MENDKSVSIAIDGPAAAGKTTLAKSLAKKLRFTYVDTGAMYRSIALFARLYGIEATDTLAAKEILDSLSFDVISDNGVQRIYIDGKETNDNELRTPEISLAASRISVLPCVRAFLLDKQRVFAKNCDVIMEGRDIGSVVLPDAVVKFYLTADLLVRAQRRYRELRATDPNVDPVKVAEELQRRDYQDSHRDEAPLLRCEDAYLIDSTKLDAEDVFDQAILRISCALMKKRKTINRNGGFINGILYMDRRQT